MTKDITRSTMDWKKSTRCESHTCVEVNRQPGRARVRDGKLGDASPILSLSPAAWKAFTSTL